MSPEKQWDDEEASSASPPPAGAAIVRRNKFDDEEAEDSDVLESWDAAEDSEVERGKAKKAAEAKEKDEAEAAAKKKSKAQRIAERIAERARHLDDSDEDEEEDEAERRARGKREEVESDVQHAAALFNDTGISKDRKAATVGSASSKNLTKTGDISDILMSKDRKATTVGSAIPIDVNDPTKTVDFSSLELLNPKTQLQFQSMHNVLTPIIAGNSKKAHYVLFLQEFTKQLAKDLRSDEIKKIASILTALGNEKQKEEKAAEKGGKKTKAAKTKTALVTTRSNAIETETFDDYDDDFM